MSQKIDAKEPEKKMPSTTANARSHIICGSYEVVARCQQGIVVMAEPKLQKACSKKEQEKKKEKLSDATSWLVFKAPSSGISPVLSCKLMSALYSSRTWTASRRFKNAAKYSGVQRNSA